MSKDSVTGAQAAAVFARIPTHALAEELFAAFFAELMKRKVADTVAEAEKCRKTASRIGADLITLIAELVQP